MRIVDMIFDEDAILLSLFERYSEESEEEDLAKAVIKYCQTGGTGNLGIGRPANIIAEKVDADDLDTVSSLPLTQYI